MRQSVFQLVSGMTYVDYLQVEADKARLENPTASPLVWKDVPLVQVVVCPDERNNLEYVTMLTLVVL